MGVAGVLLAVWLFLKRPAFDRPFSLGSLQHYVDDALAHARKRIDGARERSQARRAATEAASEDLRRKTGWEQQAQEGLTLSKTTPDGAMLVAEDDGASGSPCPAASEGLVLCPGRAEGREG